MQRRTFLRNTIAGSAGMMVIPLLGEGNPRKMPAGLNDDQLEQSFAHPPDTARPWAFYMWMNGNITKEGITADLEVMKRMGIGGAICFNSAVGIPRGAVDYAGDAWMDATLHAIREAARLGLEFTLHNSPGYSGCGGPWVTPEMSMQELVWTETRIQNTPTGNIPLSRPYAKQDYYRDAFVIAYPSLPAEKALMKDALTRILVNGQETDKSIITDGNPEIKIRIEPAGDKPAILQMEFAMPFEARAISILRKPEIPTDLFDGPRDHPPVIHLECSDNGNDFRLVGTIRCPELRQMDTPAVLSFAATTAMYYRLVFTTPSWISRVHLQSGPRLAGWPGKTNYTHGDAGGETPDIDSTLIIDPAAVIDISHKMDEKGNLQWTPPAGTEQRWTILRIGHTTTGEQCAAHPDAGAGLEIDKFRKEAVEFHFAAFLDKLLTRLKDFPGAGLKGITIDSWEAGKQNWTINFPAEFKARRNYNIVSWMPALTGRIVGSIDETERFLWDVRKTHSDLLAENFYGHFSHCCHRRGLSFSAEPYGDGNFDSLQVSQYLDTPMSEFWTRYIYGSDNYSKQAVSAAHIYGKKVAAAESFTAMPATAKWTDYPYSLKAEGDYFFTLGINRLVFHTFVHQPYTTGLPGMTMGPFGAHFDRNNTWTEQAYGWTSHLKRAQYLLQQGLAIADVCYFKGDNPESGIPDIYYFLPRGYAGDVTGADGLQRFSIDNGNIVLPDGMRYRICIMAQLKSMQPSTLNKLKELVAAGMVLLVNNKPSQCYGLSHKDEDVQQIAHELYGELDGISIKERHYGKGKIIWGKSLSQVLEEQATPLDFTYTASSQDAAIHYIHKIAGDTDFYFISNHRRRKESIVTSFRISDRQPEIWNPETGRHYHAALYETLEDRTLLPLVLEPAGALFIVFRKKSVSKPDMSVLRNGQEIIHTKSFPLPKTALYADVQNNFTVTVWAKPDTFAHGGKSMLFHPPEGETVYGKGHAAFGLSAGQNAVRVYERKKGTAREVLSYIRPVEGWTFIVVVYNNGQPTLYINGRQAGSNKGSGDVIHPGMSEPASQYQFASYFEGNYTEPQLYKHLLGEEEIKRQYAAGLPPPVLPTGMELEHNNKQLKALIWQNGMYTLKGNNVTHSLGNITGCKETAIAGSWKLRFPAGYGALPEVILPSLISLHKHENFDVKHFSGTVTYTTSFTIPANAIQAGKRLYLHLGRVEVVAEVKLNGKALGLLWKEPFLVEMTHAARAGSNNLQISITNLWPNRLIGDEALPPENEYSVHNYIEKLPDWYTTNQPKQGRRTSFAVWHTLEKDSPLLESGLLGPVKWLIAIEKQHLIKT